MSCIHVQKASGGHKIRSVYQWAKTEVVEHVAQETSETRWERWRIWGDERWGEKRRKEREGIPLIGSRVPCRKLRVTPQCQSLGLRSSSSAWGLALSITGICSCCGSVRQSVSPSAALQLLLHWPVFLPPCLLFVCWKWVTIFLMSLDKTRSLQLSFLTCSCLGGGCLPCSSF